MIDRNTILAMMLVIFTSIGTLQADQTNLPAIVIYNVSADLTASRLQVIAALWTDGTIVWSPGNAAPLLQGKFSPNQFNALMTNWEHHGIFTNQSLKQPHLGPDSSYTVIAIDDGRRHLKMQSWHELFEENTNLVATANGIIPLNGRNRDDILRQQPPDYKNFRQTWSEIRHSIRTLIPEKGEPYHGEIPLR
ncbi:MAG TPA: hypothetical protein VN625_06375 [Desulfuromonadaceae bacterium]|nr:hypothetical protein [Desulfuromonadaceae bacterium]